MPNFSESEIDKLFQMRYESLPERVLRRVDALYLKAMGLGASEICRIVRISRTTLGLWISLWEEGGLDSLTTFLFKGGRRCAFEPFKETIVAYFEKHPPRTLDEAQRKICEITGVERGRSSVREFLVTAGLHEPRKGRAP